MRRTMKQWVYNMLAELWQRRWDAALLIQTQWRRYQALRTFYALHDCGIWTGALSCIPLGQPRTVKFQVGMRASCNYRLLCEKISVDRLVFWCRFHCASATSDVLLGMRRSKFNDMPVVFRGAGMLSCNVFSSGPVTRARMCATK